EGGWTLVRMRKDEAKPQWLLIKERDEAARPANEYDVTEAQPDSVLPRRGKPRVWHSNRPATRRASAASRRARATAAAPKPSPRRTPRGRGADPSSVAGARQGPLPAHPAPQLATLVDAVPPGE